MFAHADLDKQDVFSGDSRKMTSPASVAGGMFDKYMFASGLPPKGNSIVNDYTRKEISKNMLRQ